jgi:hypothetical protein
MQSTQIKRRFLLLTYDIQKRRSLSTRFLSDEYFYLVDHFIIFDTPKTEYIIRKNEFHRPTNAYVSRKFSPYISHNVLMTIDIQDPIKIQDERFYFYFYL